MGDYKNKPNNNKKVNAKSAHRDHIETNRPIALSIYNKMQTILADPRK